MAIWQFEPYNERYPRAQQRWSSDTCGEPKSLQMATSKLLLRSTIFWTIWTSSLKIVARALWERFSLRRHVLKLCASGDDKRFSQYPSSVPLNLETWQWLASRHLGPKIKLWFPIVTILTGALIDVNETWLEPEKYTSRTKSIKGLPALKKEGLSGKQSFQLSIEEN